MGETKPSGATRTIPKEHRGTHGTATLPRPLVFGEPPERKPGHSKYRDQVRRTVISLDLVDYEIHEPPEILPEDLVASDISAEETRIGIRRRWLGMHVAHFDKPFNDPETKLIGYSTYPHQVDVDTDKDVRPTGPNDAGELILMPSFYASLIPKDVGKVPTEPTFWYAKSGTGTVRYDPERKVLYIK
ncbi:MAG: hypothetical protein UU21_C0018G0017 [Candidatus Levybacteria bacterium GW2011_GWA2_40_8]|nr:MAG: hypothetical protein UU21_C0018G0017 [Candidatus Levybacteria bacterium GW2011_GWA2_40_8]